MAVKKKKKQRGKNEREALFILMSTRVSEGENVNKVLDDLRERHELTLEECEDLLDRFENEIAKDLSEN